MKVVKATFGIDLPWKRAHRLGCRIRRDFA